MASKKEKNKKTNQVKRMALLRKAVLREIEKTEEQEALKNGTEKPEKKKIKSQPVEQKTDVAKKKSTFTDRLKNLKDDVVPKKEEKEEEKLSAGAKPLEKKTKKVEATFTDRLKNLKDDVVPKKEEKEEEVEKKEKIKKEEKEKEKLSAGAEPLEKKIKVDTAPTDIKTSKFKSIFGKQEKKSDKAKPYRSLNPSFKRDKESPSFKRDKDYSNKKTKKKKTTTAFMFFIGLTLGCLLILIIGFYVPKSENALVKKISKVIPFPAIIIDGESISYNYFLQETDMVSMFLTKQKNMGIIMELPTRDEIREDIKNLLIRQEIIKKLAVQYKISVSEKEVKDEIDQIKQKSRSEETVEKMLKDLYGWSEEDFGNKVIRPSLLSFKLAKAISPDVDDDELKKVLDKTIESEKSKIKIYVLTD
jgi:hypothetical protein